MNFVSARRRKRDDVAFVACRDSRAEAEAVARRCGVDLSGLLILSRRDNPNLRSFEDILAVLPPTIKLIVLDDVEHLLAEGRRDTATVRAFLLDLKQRYRHKGFHVLATMSDAGGDGLHDEVLR